MKVDKVLIGDIYSPPAGARSGVTVGSPMLYWYGRAGSKKARCGTFLSFDGGIVRIRRAPWWKRVLRRDRFVSDIPRK